MDTQRTEQLRNAYRRWKQESATADWFSLFRPLIADILPVVSGNAFKVYLFFCMNADPTTGGARHSVKAVADYLGRSERAVNDWIKELQEQGLIERIQATPNGEAYTYLLPRDGPSGKGPECSDGVVREAPAHYHASETGEAANLKMVIIGTDPSSSSDAVHVPESQHAFTVARLGQKIRTYRENRQMGLREISERAGVTISYLAQLEHGNRTNPSLSTLLSLSEALGVPVWRLLSEFEVS